MPDESDQPRIKTIPIPEDECIELPMSPDDPARVDRYVVIDKLGAGGFGTVYRAYDPELERFVALKVVRVATIDPERAEDLRERALREAKTLARLDHPNIVPIFAAGLVGTDVFIAMGLIEGETLDRWLRSGPRSHREILGAFLGAGRGLEAAHRSGIVHRDFKPSNVIVAKDGSVRVLDFGLARPVEEGRRATAQDDAARAATASSPDRIYVTRTGLRFGTPAYMAPEQHLAEGHDQRTDQFSFCVALYQALTGEHPFGGRTIDELSRSVIGGEVKRFPPAARVPMHVQRALLRGLSAKREDRFATMAELLVALERNPWRARRRALVAATALVVLVDVSVLAGRRIAARPPPCTGAGLVEGIWDEAARERVHRAFATTGRANAEETFERVKRRLQDYVDSASRFDVNLCEEERRGVIASNDARDRQQCANERVSEARALVRELSAASDPNVVDRAIGATGRLTRVDECRVPDRNIRHVPLPSDPALAKRVNEIMSRLAEVRARGLLGNDVSKDTAAILADARATGHSRLIATVGFAHMAVLTDQSDFPAAERVAREIVRESGRAQWFTGWRAATSSIGCTLALERKTQEAATYVPIIEGLADLERDDPQSEADVLGDLAQMEDVFGDTEKAASHATRAADLMESMGPQLRLSALYLRGLTSYELQRAGNYRGADAILSKTVPAIEAEYGSQHPRLAYALWNRSLLESALWRFEDAHADARRAGAIWATAGADSVASALEADGLTFAAEGNGEGALDVLEKARAMREGALAWDHPNLGTIAINESLAALVAGDFAMAEHAGDKAVTIYRSAFTKDHPDLDTALETDAMVKLRLGKVEDATRLARQALAERRAQGGDPLVLITALTLLTEVALRHGDAVEARELATEAVADMGDKGAPADAAQTLITAADAALAANDAAAATALLERAQSIVSPLASIAHPIVARVLLHLGDARLAAGDPAKGFALYDSVVAALTPLHRDPRDLLLARFGRARAAWALGEERHADARAEAMEIERLTAAKDVALPELHSAIGAWLRARR